MTLNIIQIAIEIILLCELIFCIVNCKVASDYTYYICRPFGISMGMGLGFILRLACATIGGILLYRGIIGFL